MAPGQAFQVLGQRGSDILYRYRLLPKPGFEFVSPSATDVTGYTPEEHYADPELGLKIVHPDDRALLEAFWTADAPFEQLLSLRWRRKDGTTIWTEQQNLPVYDGAGRLIAIEGIARDVTARKLEEERQASIHRYRPLIEANLFGVAIAEGDYIVEANDAYLEIVGITRDEFLTEKLNWRSMTLPEDLPSVERALAELHEKGMCTPFEKSYRRKDGQLVPVAIGAARLHQSPLTWVSFIYDLSSQKQTEAELGRLRDEAETRTGQIEAFVAVLAHDVRQPLTLIRGHIAIIRQAVARNNIDQIMTSTAAIDRASSGIQVMLRDLIDSVRLELGQMRLEREQIEISEFTTDLLERLKGSLDIDRVRLDMTEPVTVNADPIQLERILGNLLSNGLKYSSAGKPVTVRSGRQGTEALIAVIDEGIGIPPQAIPKLFERGFRTTEAMEYAEGFGVGLHITRLLVEAHGGRIWVTSEVGKGSVFYVALPAEPPAGGASNSTARL